MPRQHESVRVKGMAPDARIVPDNSPPPPLNSKDGFEAIAIGRWGRDHWSVFGYIGSLLTGGVKLGVPDRDRMRCDVGIHPALIGPRLAGSPMAHSKYPTRLKGGVEVSDHDDWSCADDMEAAGLFSWEGTGINPVFRLTDAGWKVLHELNEHKGRGGQFADFEPSAPLREALGIV